MSHAAVRNSSSAESANVILEYGTIAGPNPYAGGGFTLDLSARFTSIKSCQLILLTETGIAMPVPKVILDNPGAGKVQILLYVVATGAESGAVNYSAWSWSYLAVGV